MGIDHLELTASNAWLFRRFGLILGAVALLAVLKAAALSTSSKSTRDDGHLIDVAGRQRMLSQRIAKESLAYRQAMVLDLPDATRHRAQLEAAATEFRQSHADVRDRSIAVRARSARALPSAASVVGRMDRQEHAAAQSHAGQLLLLGGPAN